MTGGSGVPAVLLDGGPHIALREVDVEVVSEESEGAKRIQPCPLVIGDAPGRLPPTRPVSLDQVLPVELECDDPLTELPRVHAPPAARSLLCHHGDGYAAQRHVHDPYVAELLDRDA